ncbi:lipopolysaccharide biosynthesis protein [Enterococcus quebecensis]|uniref:Polysaccharide biosynthesis protein n=1 Tax=Enterococcus quebecensis TaxID=903983 RepID=A0A1E5GPP1_9ENTE|nr:oligosaccharide flippase family protein [Enterococcus quebecensis]OEG14681.1 polysaccharide biosynthesis protein [Enterococcus quebecensis]OJG73266.1 hypothetical protein RV12_GL000673 [Enterococcus quebecensis]
MKKFISKLMGFSIGPILGAAISFLTVPITTYYIDPSEFGKASMFSVIQYFLLSIIFLGIDQSYTREYHRVENKNKVFQNALIIPLLASMLLSVIIFIFQNQFSIFLFSDSKYPEISILFGIMIVLSVVERFILLSIRMAEKALEYSLFSVFLKLVVFVFTLVLVLSGKRTFLTIVYATIFGQFLGDAFLIIRHRKLLKIGLNDFDYPLLKKMITFGLPLVIAASLSNLLNTSGRFFLRGYSTFYELGIYTAALKISNILQIIQTAFTSFWVPTAYRWDKEKKDIKHFSFVSDILLLVMTIGFFLILFFKKYIALILSSDYSEAQFVAGLLALTPILYTLSETSTLGIVFSGKSHYNIWVSILAIIPNLVLNYLLVPKFGTIGAALATAFAYIVFCISRTYFSRKCDFKISFYKQSICICLFFIAACLNSFEYEYSYIVTLGFFIITLLVQYSTFSKIIEVKKNSEQWNFE